MVGEPGPGGIGDDASARSARALELLRRPAYAPLWLAARRRLEANGASLEGTPIDLGPLDGERAAAVGGLLGRLPAAGRPVRVRLDDLDAQLRRGAVGIGLVEVLVAVGGPLRDRRAERAAAQEARSGSWERADAHPVLAARPELRSWLDVVRRTGTATRLAASPAEAGDLVVAALDIVRRLPVATIPLARLASEATADAHALDRGAPLGTLVASALEALDPEEVRARTEPTYRPAPAYWWRRRWARVGVVCDDLSVSVLVLNLPVTGGDEVVADAVRRHREAGEPLRLTLRQLGRAVLDLDRSVPVHLCENPSVLAQAAQTLGAACAPLVCVDGQPNSAVDELLTLLSRSGSPLRYHGDFDWGGLRIADLIIRRHGARPWRYGATEYAAAAAGGTRPLGPPPPGTSSPWDPALLEVMATTDRAVHEEQLLDDLLADLGVPVRRPDRPPA